MSIGERWMHNGEARTWRRRDFLNAAGIAAASTLIGLPAGDAGAEPAPETRRIRIPRLSSTCRTPEWVAEELLRAEGFTEVQYIAADGGTRDVERLLATGGADIGGHFAAPVILRIEAGDPIVMLAGE